MTTGFKPRVTEVQGGTGYKLVEPKADAIVEHAKENKESLFQAEQEARVPDRIVGSVEPDDVAEPPGFDHVRNPVYDNEYTAPVKQPRKPYILK